MQSSVATPSVSPSPVAAAAAADHKRTQFSSSGGGGGGGSGPSLLRIAVFVYLPNYKLRHSDRERDDQIYLHGDEGCRRSVQPTRGSMERGSDMKRKSEKEIWQVRDRE